ncbi:glycerophosphodiester phosphodiesterase [Levilactobacillus brevis]|nr:glycerophosphodiester phosphodiesterase [Levilactobacillus brevis]
MDVRSWGRQLKQVWRTGIFAPGLTLGWCLAILFFAGLRLLGQRPGWHVDLVVLIGGLMILSAWQLTHLALTLIGRRPAGWQSWQLLWRHKGTWILVELGLTILALPLGLGGLSSRLLVRVPLPAGFINYVGLHRRPVGIVVAIIYLLVASGCLLRGPWVFRRLAPQIQHPGTWRQMATALLVSAGLLAVWWGLAEGLVALNWWGDAHLSPGPAKLLAAGSLLLIFLGFVVAVILAAITLVWSWCGQPTVSRPVPRHQGWWLMGVLVVAGACVSGQALLSPPQFAPMVAISHRGVDHGVGVQNTLGALRHVSRQHPAYVEMDLHETRDHQWVVLHDENLAVLARRNVTPHQLTLAQLEQLTVHENGYHDRLVGWATYLKVAERLRQPLLVEIKTTPQDSPNAIHQFARQYGTRLRRDGSAVHSLDYRVVTQLKQVVPQLRVGYITPFNWVSPAAVPADFYSFQRISLSQQFILAAHQAGAPAWVWTPDSRAAMSRMWALGADGEITNELSRLQSVMRQSPSENWWAVVQNFIHSYLSITAE